MLYRYIEEYAQFWFVFREPYSGVWLYMDVWLIKIGFVFRDPCGSVCMLKSDSYFGRLVGGVCAYNMHTP